MKWSLCAIRCTFILIFTSGFHFIYIMKSGFWHLLFCLFWLIYDFVYSYLFTLGFSQSKCIISLCTGTIPLSFVAMVWSSIWSGSSRLNNTIWTYVWKQVCLSLMLISQTNSAKSYSLKILNPGTKLPNHLSLFNLISIYTLLWRSKQRIWRYSRLKVKGNLEYCPTGSINSRYSCLMPVSLWHSKRVDQTVLY